MKASAGNKNCSRLERAMWTHEVPVLCVTEALKEAKEREEEELRRRREAEDAEIAKRLREGREREMAAAATLEQGKPQTDERPPEPPGSPEETHEKPPEAPEQVVTAEQLKKTYRQLRKRSNAEDIEEMKRIKKQIAELTGRKKKVEKHLKKERREAVAPPPEADEPIWRTEEQIEDEKRRERVREMLKMQQSGAAGMLAKVLEGRGVKSISEDEEESPGEEGEEGEREDEDQSVGEEEESEISSCDDTISSVSAREVQDADLMSGGSGAPYKAIKVNARIVQETAAFPPEVDSALFSREQLALRDKAYFSGFLSADTDSETAEWLTVFNGRKAFFRYLSACRDAGRAPMLPIVASLWSPGPREIVLQGVPHHKEVDKAIFTSIKVPYLDSLCCGWRGMDSDGLAASLQNISCKVRTLDLTANLFGSTALTCLGDFCNNLRVSHLCLAENNIAGDSTAAQRIANFIADPDPIFLDLRRTAIVDEDCHRIARELENVRNPGLVPKIVSFGENDISVEGLKVVAEAVAKTLPRLKPDPSSPPKVASTSLFLAFFEVRGPALLRYSAPPRPSSLAAVTSKQSAGLPPKSLARSFGNGLEGIFLTSVSLTASKLTVTGKKILSSDLVSRESSETWVLQADSDDYLQEWFRVLRIRQVGVACDSIGRSSNEALHPGVGQYCTSCFRRSLELGGRQLAPGQFARLFLAVSIDYRLKSVDMSNMELDVEAVRRFPKDAFCKSELTFLDLSFNLVTPQGDMSNVVAFCGSAKNCASLVLDGNPLGDTEATAGFVYKLLECRIQNLCLNACGLGDTFAEALTKRITSEPKRFPFITALELQATAISLDSMKNMLDALIHRSPGLSKLSLYGNGFDNIGPFTRHVTIDYTKTHRDGPTRQVSYCRRVVKKPATASPRTPGGTSSSDKTVGAASQPAAAMNSSLPQGKGATTTRKASNPEPAFQGP
ncbi:hypothetical protein, conserved [Eimeria praecox]|uniref:Uncharacterized protein n=1 Tax=Eimeria praecox TaxID=51316 RepID=U6H4T6_9EIME|nr:hypothetical protein, conserved [Eimeria praecox]